MSFGVDPAYPPFLLNGSVGCLKLICSDNSYSAIVHDPLALSSAHPTPGHQIAFGNGT